MAALEFPTPRCGFCGASGTASCREFLQDVDPHQEREVSLFYAPLDGPTIGREDLFIDELDGMTLRSLEEVADYHQYLSESYAENAWLRHAETNDRYAWEDEQDRMRAAGLSYWF